MSTLAQQRLAEERKNFRKDKPFGFSAKPRTREDGSINLFHWDCIVPGKDGTYIEGGKFPVHLKFPPNFPSAPPAAYMPAGFFHVNVFDNGAICLSIFKTEMPSHLRAMSAADVWQPGISIKQILLSVQELLHNPNFGSVANPAAWELKQQKGMAAYEKRMRAQTAQYSKDEFD